jgi:hypothetical protein
MGFMVCVLGCWVVVLKSHRLCMTIQQPRTHSMSSVVWTALQSAPGCCSTCGVILTWGRQRWEAGSGGVLLDVFVVMQPQTLQHKAGEAAVYGWRLSSNSAQPGACST